MELHEEGDEPTCARPRAKCTVPDAGETARGAMNYGKSNERETHGRREPLQLEEFEFERRKMKAPQKDTTEKDEQHAQIPDMIEETYRELLECLDFLNRQRFASPFLVNHSKRIACIP